MQVIEVETSTKHSPKIAAMLLENAEVSQDETLYEILGGETYVCWFGGFKTRWWFQAFFMFHPYLSKWWNLTIIFQMGWNHQLEKVGLRKWWAQIADVESLETTSYTNESDVLFFNLPTRWPCCSLLVKRNQRYLMGWVHSKCQLWYSMLFLFLFLQGKVCRIPICSMYGIFRYVYHKHQQNVGKCSLHGAYGIVGEKSDILRLLISGRCWRRSCTGWYHPSISSACTWRTPWQGWR